MDEIVNGNEDVFLFKIIATKYVEDFIKHGKLVFSCAKNYSELSKQGNPGQGDDEEGLFGRVLKNDARIEFLENHYKNNLIKEPYIKDSNYLDLRLTYVNFMPIYCLYSLKVNDFSKNISQPKTGFNSVDVNISHSFFKDFSNHSQKQSLIFIEQGKEFIHRLISKLTEQGYESLCGDVNYVERNKTFLYPPAYHPNELFCKDKSRFEDQKELRVVIKNKSLEKADNNQLFISLGCLSDIVHHIDTLPEGDLTINARVLLSEISNN